MKKYYEFEKVKKAVPFETIPDEVRAQYLRPGELLAIQENFSVAFQPIGTLEWHGRQNPIGCDAIKAEMLCISTAKKIGGVVMPPFYFSTDVYRDCGNGYGLGMDPEAGFQLPGSFYQIDTSLLKNFILNACQNYLQRGFKMVVLVSGHNPSIQQNLMDEVCYSMKTDEGQEPVIFTMEYTVIEKGNPRRVSDHAAGYETSMMLHLAHDRVNMKANDMQEIPDLGIGGRTSYLDASKEEGMACFELQVEGMSKFVTKHYQKLISGS